MRRYAKRLTEITPFRVVEVLERAKVLESEGHRVVHFEVGEPDFPTAAPIVRAAHSALDAGATKYTEALGIPALRSRISAHYAELGAQVGAERVVVTTGASASLLLLAGLLLDPGQEMLLPDPGYPCNRVFAGLVGAHARALPVKSEHGYVPRVGDLRDAWTERTQALLLASPANPTGAVIPAADLKELAAAVADLGGDCLLDEIYQGLTYGGSGAEYATGLTIDNQLYVINSFSKYFGMTGWRLGWLVLPDAQAVAAIAPLAQNLYISPPALSQHAALAAFTPEATAIHEQRRSAFAERRERLHAGLLELGFGLTAPPAGAFYLYADLRSLGLEMDGMQFCRRLLEEHHVAVTPGVDFGDFDTASTVRFAYTTDLASIDLGLERIQQALRAF